MMGIAKDMHNMLAKCGLRRVRKPGVWEYEAERHGIVHEVWRGEEGKVDTVRLTKEIEEFAPWGIVYLGMGKYRGKMYEYFGVYKEEAEVRVEFDANDVRFVEASA